MPKGQRGSIIQYSKLTHLKNFEIPLDDSHRHQSEWHYILQQAINKKAKSLLPNAKSS